MLSVRAHAVPGHRGGHTRHCPPAARLRLAPARGARRVQAFACEWLNPPSFLRATEPTVSTARRMPARRPGALTWSATGRASLRASMRPRRSSSRARRSAAFGALLARSTCISTARPAWRSSVGKACARGSARSRRASLEMQRHVERRLVDRQVLAAGHGQVLRGAVEQESARLPGVLADRVSGWRSAPLAADCTART